MDPANRIGAPAAAATSVPMPTESAVSAPAAGFNPIGLLLPMVTGKFNEWKNERMQTLRPMSSFLSRDKLSLPAPTELLSRVKTNLFYFQTNYFILFAVLGIYCVYVPQREKKGHFTRARNSPRIDDFYDDFCCLIARLCGYANQRMLISVEIA